MVMLESKFHPPELRPEHVSRPRLLELLDASSARRLTVVCAPAGYGKSALLAEWTAQISPDRHVAWLTVDEQENSPASLCAYVLEALHRTAAENPEPDFDSIRWPADSLTGATILKVLNTLWRMEGQLVLIIDNYHEITNNMCHEVLHYFLMRLPPTVKLVLGTRFDPPLGLGVLRARGELGELRTTELEFTDKETDELLNQKLRLGLPAADVRYLQKRTEGWAAGLYLAALSLRDHPDPQAFVAAFAGPHRHLVDYFGVEVLERLPDADRTFLVQTALLDQVSAPLADALQDSGDAAARLHQLAQYNQFVFPLDEAWQWYRYHPLFRDLLLVELQRRFPERVAELHQRAAAWYAASGDAPAAMRHTLAVGDERLVGDLFITDAVPLVQQGQLATVVDWLAALPEAAVAARPPLALATAWAAALAGQPAAEVLRRIALAEANGADEGPFVAGEPSLAAALALARAHWVVDDVGAALADAEAAVMAITNPETPAYLLARLALGQALYLAGRPAEAQAPLEAAVRAPLAPQQASGHSRVLATLALVNLALGKDERAAELARQAVQVAAVQGIGPAPHLWLSMAALGQVLVRQGRLEEAAHVLAQGVETHLELLRAWPIMHVLALVPLVMLRHRQGDAAAAHLQLVEARAVVRDCRDAGMLPGLLSELERGLGRQTPRPAGLQEPLSEGELRILRLLAGDLSQREIGQELYLSVNTVKSHVRNIYGKLDAGSRAEAVARARALGLIASQSTSTSAHPGEPAPG